MKWISKLDRATLAWTGLIMAAVILLCVNVISSSVFGGFKADLTEQNLFTISSGTRDILRRIDEPINVRLYYSKRLGEAAPNYAKFFERVRSLLEQYRDISQGKLEISFLDPEPFSDAEDRAVAAGLRGVRLNQEGDMGYFGLVATNSTDNDATIPFFSQERERFLEYDITKLVHTLANPKRTVVGLITGIDIDAGLTPSRQMRPAWQVMNQIREVFDVKTLGQNLKEIPEIVDPLLLIEPDKLTAEAAYAIDQFALRGGHVLAFVDPVSELGHGGAPSFMGGGGDSKEVGKLLTSWGVGFDRDKVVGDISQARRVQFAGGAKAVVTEYVAWLALDRRNLDEKDVVTGGIDKLNFASAGFLTPIDGAGTKVVPIVKTSAQAMAMEASALRIRPDPVALLRDYRPGSKSLILAARISGEAKSAFPGGRPKPKAKEGEKTGEKAEDKGAGAKGQDKDKKADSEKSADAKSAEKPHRKSGNINVIVVADTDMLHDQFWVDVQNFLGQQVMIPNAHNASFVLNALDNLSGGESLIALRGRGVDDRPFELVNDIRRNAERHYRQQEQRLLAKLKELEGELQKVQGRGDGGEVILSDKDKEAIEKFRAEMIAVRRKLRAVKHALREDIDRLDGVLKFTNIAGVPLLIGFGAVAVALADQRRRRRKF